MGMVNSIQGNVVGTLQWDMIYFYFYTRYSILKLNKRLMIHIYTLILIKKNLLIKVILIEDGSLELVTEKGGDISLKKLSVGALICVCFSFLCGVSSILCCK